MLGIIIEFIGRRFSLDDYRNFEKCIPWLPKRCCLSNKLLWLKPCYRAKYVINKPPFGEYFIWIDERELIVYRLNE